MVRDFHSDRVADSKFIIRIEPLDDELLSSWLVRMAYAHATSPATFVNLHFPQLSYIFWTRDVDLSASDEFLKILSKKSGLSFESLRKLTLRSYEGYLSEHISLCSNYFIQPMGYLSYYKGRNPRRGLSYCPLCLREDKVPYFRRKWRLIFSTACIKHGCFLLDRCKKCGSPVRLYRNYFDRSFPHCYKCGEDYKRVPPENVKTDLHGLQSIKQLYEILDSGCFSYKDRYMYSSLFFDMLRQVIKIACYGKKNRTFFDCITEAAVKERVSQHQRFDYIADLPVSFRYSIFAAAVNLFKHFPGSLIAYFSANELRKTDIVRDLKSSPYEYNQIAEKYDRDERPIMLDEVKSAIRYLKRKNVKVYREQVQRLMGVRLDFRGKREDIKRLFKKGDETRLQRNK